MSQIEEGICWFAWTVWENLFVFQLLHHPAERVCSTSGLSMRVNNKLLS